MNWQKIFPWAAVAGAIIGIAVGDYFLVFLAILLLAGVYFWRTAPEDEESDD